MHSVIAGPRPMKGEGAVAGGGGGGGGMKRVFWGLCDAGPGGCMRSWGKFV